MIVNLLRFSPAVAMKPKLAVKKKKTERKMILSLFESRLEAGSYDVLYALTHTPNILPLHSAPVWEAARTGGEGEESRTSAEISMFPVILLCLSVPLHIYQCYSIFTRREKDRAVLYESYLKGLHPRLPHTHRHPFIPGMSDLQWSV